MGARQPPNAFSSSPSTCTSPKHSGRSSPTPSTKIASASAGEHINSPEMRPLNVKKSTPGQVRNYILNLEQTCPQAKAGTPYSTRPESPTRQRPACPEFHIAEKVSSSSKHAQTTPKSTRAASQVSLLSAKFESEPDEPSTLPKLARHKQATSSSDSVSWISPASASALQVESPLSSPFASKNQAFKEISRSELKSYHKSASSLYNGSSSSGSSIKQFSKDLASVKVRPVSPVNSIEHRAPLAEQSASSTRSNRASHDERSPHSTDFCPGSPTTKHKVPRNALSNNTATTPRASSPVHTAQAQSPSARATSPRRKMVGGGMPDNQFSWADATLSSPTGKKAGAVETGDESLPPPKPRRQGNDGWQTPSRTQTVTDTSTTRLAEARSRSPSPKPRAQLEHYFPKTAPLALKGVAKTRSQWSPSREVSPARSSKGERSPSPRLRRDVETIQKEDESLNRSPSAASAFSWVSSDETLLVKRGDFTRLDIKSTSPNEKQLKDISASRSSTLKSTNSSVSSCQAPRPASPIHHVAFQNKPLKTDEQSYQKAKSPSLSRASPMSPNAREAKKQQGTHSDTRASSLSMSKQLIEAPTTPTAYHKPRTASPSTPSASTFKTVHTIDNKSIPYTPQFEKSFSMFSSSSRPKPELADDMSPSQLRTRPAPTSPGLQEVGADQNSAKLARHKTTPSMGSGTSVAQGLSRQASPLGSHATGFVVHNRVPSPKLGKTPLLPPPVPVFSYVPYEETESEQVEVEPQGRTDLPEETPLDRVRSTASSRRGATSPEAPLYRQSTTNSDTLSSRQGTQLDRTGSSASKYSVKSSSDDWTVYASQTSVLSRAQSIMSANSVESSCGSRSFSGSSGMSVTSVQTQLTVPTVGARSPELGAAEFKQPSQLQREPSGKDYSGVPLSAAPAQAAPPAPRAQHAEPKQEFDLDSPLPRYDDLDLNTMAMPNSQAAVPPKEPVTPLEKLFNDKLLRDIFFCYIFAIYIIA